MIKYSPYIEGTLPAFTYPIGSKSKSKLSDLKIPFEMNPAVGKQEIKGFVVKIKPTATSDQVAYISSTGTSLEKNVALVEKALQFGIVDFSLGGGFPWNYGSLIGKFSAGQYYKVQLAYFDQEFLNKPDSISDSTEWLKQKIIL